MLVDNGRLGHRRHGAIEAFLLLHVLFGIGVDRAVRIVLEQAAADQLALLVHAGREEFDDQGGGKAIDDEAGQAVALGVDQAIGIGDRVELEQVAAQADRGSDLALEEGLVDLFVGIGA